MRQRVEARLSDVRVSLEVERRVEQGMRIPTVFGAPFDVVDERIGSFAAVVVAGIDLRVVRGRIGDE